jgi:hypothetical protein
MNYRREVTSQGLWVYEFLVKHLAHGLRAGPFLFAGDDETPIERGMM